MKGRLFKRIQTARSKLAEKRSARRKGLKSINMATIHTVAVLTNKFFSKGFSLQSSASLAQRLTCSKRALNKMRIGNSKTNPNRMKRIFELITEHFLEEEKLSRLGFKGESSELQRQLLDDLVNEIGGRRAFARFARLEEKAEEDLKRVFEEEAPKQRGQ